MDDMRLAGKHMSKLLAISIAAIMALSPVSGIAAPPTKDGTQSGTPSSKAATAINTISVSSDASFPACTAADNGPWVDVMQTTIKTSNVADLFVGVSLVTGLFTSTTVSGNEKGTRSTATAMGGVAVRVLLDGQPGLAYPDQTGCGVTFDQRIQTLTAMLGFIFDSCFAAGGTTGTCTPTLEEITLILDTTSAHS